MPEVFLLLALVLSGGSILLYFAPHLRILNFVDYDLRSVANINRYAAVRLLLPIGVSLGCAGFAATWPAWSVPLIFPTIVSILAAVIWIAAGVTGLENEQG